MTDITNPKLLWAKGGLFLGLGLGASALLIMEAASLKVAVLLAVSVWAFCRAYYFALGRNGKRRRILIRWRNESYALL